MIVFGVAIVGFLAAAIFISGLRDLRAARNPAHPKAERAAAIFLALFAFAFAGGLAWVLLSTH